MRLAPFLILLCVTLLQCNGAPTEEVAAKKRSRGVNYTTEEEEFIIRVLSNLPFDNRQMSSKFLWEHVSVKVRENYTLNIFGFPKARSAKSLRGHFKSMVMLNHPLINRVPENLLLKFRPDLNKHPQGRRQIYTKEEEQLVIDELLSTPGKNLFASEVWATIRAKHNLKRQAGTAGFEHKRTPDALRVHFILMKQKRELPSELLKKIRKHDKGASTSEPVSLEDKTVLKDTHEDDDTSQDDDTHQDNGD